MKYDASSIAEEFMENELPIHKDLEQRWCRKKATSPKSNIPLNKRTPASGMMTERLRSVSVFSPRNLGNGLKKAFGLRIQPKQCDKNETLAAVEGSVNAIKAFTFRRKSLEKSSSKDRVNSIETTKRGSISEKRGNISNFLVGINRVLLDQKIDPFIKERFTILLNKGVSKFSSTEQPIKKLQAELEDLSRFSETAETSNVAAAVPGSARGKLSAISKFSQTPKL